MSADTDQQDQAAGPPPTAEEPGSQRVVEQLCADYKDRGGRLFRSDRRMPLPSRDEVIAMVEELRSVLFPGYFGPSALSAETVRYYVGAALDRVTRTLHDQIQRGLCFVCPQDDLQRCAECPAQAARITTAFVARLPEIRRLLSLDVRAAYEGDPAARSEAETVFCYPGILALISHRLAHELHRLEVPLIPRIITEHAHSITGIDIHPGATIGEGLFIDHGTGVVIGETSEIGKRVRIYQGVTLGAKSFPLDQDGNPIKGVPRHPIVEDDVTIYSGATILGRITIGQGAVIGGNVWLTRSVPPGRRITQAQARNEKFVDGGGI